MKDRIRKLIASPRSVVAAIAAALIASLIGVVVPQEALMTPLELQRWKAGSPVLYAIADSVGLNRIFSTVWFFALVLILAVMLGYSLYRQGRALLKLKGRSLRKWGAFVFHAGLMVVIAASLYTVGFRKMGVVMLMDMETYSGDDESMIATELGAFAGRFYPDFTIKLLKFEPEYWEDGTVRDIRSTLEFRGGWKPKIAEIGINDIEEYEGVKVYQSRRFGYTLSFLYSDDEGKRFVTHYLVDAPPVPAEFHYGTSDIPTTSYRITLWFHPDHTKTSFNLDEPAVKLDVGNGFSSIYNGTMVPGETVGLSEGEYFTWTAIRPWTGIRLVRNIGASVVFGGFALMIAGLMLLYFVPGKPLK